MTLQNKLIINAAVTGTVLYKKGTTSIPVTIDEIVSCARRVRDAGAAIIHLHARNADESPCYDPAVYKTLVEQVRKATDLIVCVSLSGRYVSDVETRAAALAAAPDMASLTLGSMNFINGLSANAPETIVQLTKRIYAAGAIPELEIFEVGFINYANYLIRKQVLRPPYYFNFILGSLGTAPLDLLGLGHMVSMIPQGSIWSVGGLGRYQIDANVISMAAGGHVRVGLEDNIFYDRQRMIPATNEQLVARIARIAREMGRVTVTPDEAREILGLW